MSEIVNEVVPIEAIADHPRNYRAHPDEQVAKLRASIARFGQVKSVVIQRGAPGKFLMVAGHGVKQAAIEQGLETLRADVIPADWTEEQILGYLVADNMTGAEDDIGQLVALLQEQQTAGYDIASLGYTDDDVEAFLRELRDREGLPDFDALVDPSGGGGAADMSWNIIVSVNTSEERETLVSQLREMGYEPEVTSVRALV
jgi:ParB-like chromosome segregation protein Spo0J